MFGTDPDQVERRVSRWAGQFPDKAERLAAMRAGRAHQRDRVLGSGTSFPSRPSGTRRATPTAWSPSPRVSRTTSRIRSTSSRASSPGTPGRKAPDGPLAKSWAAPSSGEVSQELLANSAKLTETAIRQTVTGTLIRLNRIRLRNRTQELPGLRKNTGPTWEQILLQVVSGRVKPKRDYVLRSNVVSPWSGHRPRRVRTGWDPTARPMIPWGISRPGSSTSSGSSCSSEYKITSIKPTTCLWMYPSSRQNRWPESVSSWNRSGHGYS